MRGDDLGPLPARARPPSRRRGSRASPTGRRAGVVRRRGVDGGEVVEDVEAGDLSVAADRGGAAGRGLADVERVVAGPAGRQASVPVMPPNDQCSTPVRPVIVSPPRKRFVVEQPARRVRDTARWPRPVTASFWSSLSSSRMIRRCRLLGEVRGVAGDARRVDVGELVRPRRRRSARAGRSGASSKYSVTLSVSVNVVSIPSNGSYVAAASARRGGRQARSAVAVGSAGAAGRAPSTRPVAVPSIWVMRRTRRRPVTRTRSPAVRPTGQAPAADDEHALGGRRVAVAVGVLLLDEEAAERVAGGVRRR